jgi:uncharacterized membrane protein YeaQ/YmgE (transglycosylase-associated protein family)
VLALCAKAIQLCDRASLIEPASPDEVHRRRVALVMAVIFTVPFLAHLLASLSKAGILGALVGGFLWSPWPIRRVNGWSIAAMFFVPSFVGIVIPDFGAGYLTSTLLTLAIVQVRQR